MSIRRSLWACSALIVSLAGCSSAVTPQQSTAAEPTTQAATAFKPVGNEGQPAPDAVKQAIAKSLASIQVKSTITSAQQTALPGIYWVTFTDMPPVFISGDGKTILQGDMLRIENGQVASGNALLERQHARNLLSQVKLSDTIVFPAIGKKRSRVYAFTDVECGYCRKLHSQIEAINAKGIEVVYLAWPRAQQDVPIMNQVWCSADRRAALTQAKLGMPLPTNAACQTPVLQQRNLGMQLGVQGTPAVYSEAGEYLGGYITPEDLAAKLNLR